MKNTRLKTRKVKIGNITIGGGNPVVVQSMTNTKTADVAKTVAQIKSLEKAGCELVRVSVPDMKSANVLGRIKKAINIPLVADIHFDYRIALESIRQGVDKLRINPGNIGSHDKVSQVVNAAKKARIPIRIGVNAGSLKNIHNQKTPQARAKILVDSALEHVKILEKSNFKDIVISLKASDVLTSVEAYRLISKKTGYPLHVGITEAGTVYSGTIKSSVGLGIILNDGIGDTIRVSLTSRPEEEVKAAYKILQSLNLRSSGFDVVSCPTCSRCEVDLEKIAFELEKKLESMGLSKKYSKRPVKIAVMGCIVNGPGEAKEADIGIAGGKGIGLLFKKGKIIKKVEPKDWVKSIVKLISEVK